MIRISREQGIYLFSVLPLKLVTPLSINDATSALPRAGQAKLCSRLRRCAPSKTVYCSYGVHHQRIRSNVILLFFLFFLLKLNELQRLPPKSLLNDILHYSDACMSFGSPFQCFYVCFRSKHSEIFSR